VKSSPHFSVIVPLFNKGPYIARAVGSVLAQDWPDYELLVIDDGSTDNGVAIIKEQFSDPRIRIVAQANSGEGAARNRGLAEMRGRIAALLDADDEWLPTHLRDLGEVAAEFPPAGVLATGFRAVHWGGLEVAHSINHRSPALIPDYFRFAMAAPVGNMSACALSTALVSTGIRFCQNAPIGADHEFLARAAMHSPFAYHPRISSVYHRDLSSNSMSGIGWLPGPPLTYTKLCEMMHADAVPSDRTTSVSAYLGWIIEEHALAGLTAGKRDEVLELLRRAQNDPIPGFSKRRLRRLELLVMGAPLRLLRLAARFRKSRWYLATAGPLFRRAARQPIGSPRSTCRTFHLISRGQEVL